MGIELLMAAIILMGMAHYLDTRAAPWVARIIERHVDKSFDENQVFTNISSKIPKHQG